jgi:hypothetical protein
MHSMYLMNKNSRIQTSNNMQDKLLKLIKKISNEIN